MNGEITREERRQRTLRQGTSRLYVTCPLCGLNRVLDKHEKGRIRFGNFDLKSSFFIQNRVGGGYGSGFWLNAANSLRISEIVNDTSFRDLLVQIKKQCTNILDHFNKIGF